MFVLCFYLQVRQRELLAMCKADVESHHLEAYEMQTTVDGIQKQIKEEKQELLPMVFDSELQTCQHEIYDLVFGTNTQPTYCLQGFGGGP